VAPSADAVIVSPCGSAPILLALFNRPGGMCASAGETRSNILSDDLRVGTVGITPVGSSTYSLPIGMGAAGRETLDTDLRGFKFHAPAAEAELRAQRRPMSRAGVLINRIVRDVAQLAESEHCTTENECDRGALEEANTALDLADTSYRLGLSST